MKLPGDNQSHPVLTWIDARFPLSKLWHEHASQYYAPKTLNIWYYGGGILLTVLALQLLTGWYTHIDRSKPVPERVQYKEH